MKPKFLTTSINNKKFYIDTIAQGKSEDEYNVTGYIDDSFVKSTYIFKKDYINNLSTYEENPNYDDINSHNSRYGTKKNCSAHYIKW